MMKNLMNLKMMEIGWIKEDEENDIEVNIDVERD